MLRTYPMIHVSHGDARGKLILMGEHSVVYGRPAIGTSMDIGMRVSLERAAEGAPPPPGGGPAGLDEKGRRAVAGAARAVGIDPGALLVRVVSRIPTGQGLGSSAAFSVASARALLRAAGREETDEAVLATAQLLESVFHGSPSGIDATLALGGGPLLFCKGSPPSPLTVGRPFALVAIASGSSPATSTMVERVQGRRAREPGETDRLFDRIGELVRAAAACIGEGRLRELGEAMNENHDILARLGVSTPLLDGLRRAALAAGSPGAKLTGGGGGGAVIFLAEDAGHARKIVRALQTGRRSYITIVRDPAEINASTPRTPLRPARKARGGRILDGSM